jgi:hypothetical protein
MSLHTLPVHPSVGDPVARKLVANALATATDGATVMATGLPYAGSGIIVALPEHGYVVPIGSLGLASPRVAHGVRRWVDRVASAVTERSLRPRAFGAWIDGDSLYLDVVEIFPGDQEDEAVAAGRTRNQISVWHAGRKQEIPTGGTGELPAGYSRP